VNCDRDGQVKVDENSTLSWPKVFAAGDVTNVTEQVLVHIGGGGARAAISAHHYLPMR
jgi:alkyl hydroperoxide reductase subunit AhpF